jgi:hypothetical protein
MGSRFLPIMAWAYGDAHRRYLVGVVVELPDGCWVYRPFRPEDRLSLPVETGELVTTLRPYITPPTNGEEAPDESYACRKPALLQRLVERGVAEPAGPLPQRQRALLREQVPAPQPHVPVDGGAGHRSERDGTRLAAFRLPDHASPRGRSTSVTFMLMTSS